MMWPLLLATIILAGTAKQIEGCAFKDLTSVPQSVQASSTSRLLVWRSAPIDRTPSLFFADVVLQLDIKDPDAYNMFWGPNCSVVIEEYENNHIFFGFLKGVQFFRRYHLPPFNETFLGVDTVQPYKVATSLLAVNPIRVLLFGAAVLTFLLSPLFVRHILFYYASGCSVGLLASVLLIAIIFYRITPKKAVGIPILLGGWSLTAYMMHAAWNNFSDLIQNYQLYIIGYFAAWILVSLAYCYRKGPPTDVRSLNLMQWSIQTVACIIMYSSGQIPEISLGIIAVLLTYSLLGKLIVFPFKLFGRFFYSVKSIFFKPKTRFLTEEEYQQQMRETTDRELKKLRNYCRSPDANWMKITRNVHDPKKLSRFAEGMEDHISEDEVLEHELAADALDRSEDDSAWIDDDDRSEYNDNGWESASLDRRPMSSLESSRRFRQYQVPRDMKSRISASAPRPVKLRSHLVRPAPVQHHQSRHTSLRYRTPGSQEDDYDYYQQQDYTRAMSSQSRRATPATYEKRRANFLDEFSSPRSMSVDEDYEDEEERDEQVYN